MRLERTTNLKGSGRGGLGRFSVVGCVALLGKRFGEQYFPKPRLRSVLLTETRKAVFGRPEVKKRRSEQMGVRSTQGVVHTFGT